jgi:hypothetical protein
MHTWTPNNRGTPVETDQLLTPSAKVQANEQIYNKLDVTLMSGTPLCYLN